MTIELTSQLIFWGALLGMLAILASVLSRRLGAPLLLLFLVLGMLAGEDGPGRIQFDDFGVAFLCGNLALAIIIFDGGLGTRRDTFRVALSPALSLATLGVLITAGVTGLAAYWLLGLSWQEGLLIGAIVGSTDAAAVFGLLGTASLDLKERTRATLEIESGSNDPMAIFLTLTLVQLLVDGERFSGWALAAEFIRQMGLGLVIGLLAGYLLTRLLRYLVLPRSLYPLLALAGGITIFGLTNLAGGSGFLAIYLAGFLLGNATLPHGSDIHRFHDGIAWLSQIAMFLMLGLLVTPSAFLPLVLPVLGITLVLILVARPLAVWISLLPFHFPWREQLFISWCGLRGAVPIILALFPSLAGLENTEVYFELAFFVVLISLLLQGWTLAPLARWLRIEVPHPAAEASYLSLPLPDDPEKALRLYAAVKGCTATGMRLADLPLSEGAQRVGLIRQGVMLEARTERHLNEGDLLVVLATEESSQRLGRLFTPPAAPTGLQANEFFGPFAINADTRLTDLAQFYGMPLSPAQARLSVAGYIQQRFHNRAVVGDEVQLGAIRLVVRELDNGRISKVGIKLGHHSGSDSGQR